MSDKLKSILKGAGSGDKKCELIMNAEDYAQRVLLQGKPIPWFDATAYANHLNQTVALLKPQVAVISLDKMIKQELDTNQQLITAMSEKKRKGYALKIFMSNEVFKAAVSTLVTSTVLRQHIPIVIQLPSPLQLLYLTSSVAQPNQENEFDTDDAENAAIYFADWLRALNEAGIAGLIFDEREGEVAKDAYQPILNTAKHYQWVVGVRRDSEILFNDSHIAVPVLRPSFWISGKSDIKMSGAVFTEIADNAVPEQVLEYRQTIS